MNPTPHMIYSNSDTSDIETFVNSDDQKRYTKFFAPRNVLSKRGFIFDVEDEHLGLTGEIRRIITSQK